MKTEISTLQGLAIAAGDELKIHYVPLTDLEKYFLQSNSKKHDIDTLHKSVGRYSFRDPIAFDLTLNGGKGGIIEGNGRLELLCQLFKAKDDAPKGVRVGDDDEWYVPCVFGVNSDTEGEAIAYSIDHNTSAMWGTEGFTALDTLRLFDEDLLKIQLGELMSLSIDFPVGLEQQELSIWLGLEEPPDRDKLPDPGDAASTDIEKQWGVIVFCQDEAEQVELMDSMIAEGKQCKALMS
jgi:hypothetical protein